jgi:hypothetical protein
MMCARKGPKYRRRLDLQAGLKSLNGPTRSHGGDRAALSIIARIEKCQQSPKPAVENPVASSNQGRTRACYPLPDRGYSGRRENPNDRYVVLVCGGWSSAPALGRLYPSDLRVMKQEGDGVLPACA